MNLFTKIASGAMALALVCGCETAAMSARAPGTDGDSSVTTSSLAPAPAMRSVALPQQATDIDAPQDNDHDHFEVEADCNDHNPDVHPGAFELCDYLDNNCNGATDENWKTVFDGAYGTPCQALATNGCWSDGIWTCDFSRKWLACNASPRTPTLEVCDGVDNDCNGVTDVDEWPLLGQLCETEEDGCTRVGLWVCDSYTKNSYCTSRQKPTADEDALPCAESQ